MNKSGTNPKKKLRSLWVPKEIAVLVTSIGGVGSTFFIEHINKYKATNNISDNDRLKHLPFPPLSLNKNIKYIFIYGNPINSVISLFRRNYHPYHSKKILSFNTELKAIEPGTTLEEYARSGVDRFMFLEQFNNWLTQSHFYPTLFLKYETLWENLDTLYDFLEIPREEIKSFPVKDQRKSDFSSLDKDTQNALKNIYGEFERYIDDFEDCLIVNERKKPLIPRILFTKTFYYTARRSLAIRINEFSPSLSNYLENLYFSKRK